MNGILYLLLFPGGKGYIGITSRGLRRRVNIHLRHAHLRDHPISRAIREQGQSFTSEILETGSMEDLAELEILYIGICGTQEPGGYNSSPGGDLGMLGLHHTPETRRRIGRAATGRPGHWKGKRIPNWVRSKISATSKGRVNVGRIFTQEHRDRISLALTGRVNGPRSPKVRQRIAETVKRTWYQHHQVTL